MLPELTTSARPRHSASPSTRRASFARRRHAASMAVLVILTGPSRSTFTAASAEPDTGQKGRPDRTVTGHGVRMQAEDRGRSRKAEPAQTLAEVIDAWDGGRERRAAEEPPL